MTPGGRRIDTSVSIGVASFPEDDHSLWVQCFAGHCGQDSAGLAF